MNAAQVLELIEFVTGFEGFDPVCRLDGEAKTPTIGHGFNLLRKDAFEQLRRVGVQGTLKDITSGKVTITRGQAMLMATGDVRRAGIEASGVFPELQEAPWMVRKIVLDLVYNLGLPRFKKFTGFIGAIRARRWALAGLELVFTDLGSPATSGYWLATTGRARHHASALGALEKAGTA